MTLLFSVTISNVLGSLFASGHFRRKKIARGQFLADKPGNILQFARALAQCLQSASNSVTVSRMRSLESGHKQARFPRASALNSDILPVRAVDEAVPLDRQQRRKVT